MATHEDISGLIASTVEFPPQALTLSNEAGATKLDAAKHYPKLETSLANLAVQANVSLSDALQLAASADLRVSGNMIYVQVALRAEAFEGVQAAIGAAGGQVTGVTDDHSLLQGWLPVNALESVASSVDVQIIRRPIAPIPLEVAAIGGSTTEGLAAMNAAPWHSAALNGAGVKVAIIDGGFQGYPGLVGSDLPSPITVKNFVDGETDAQVDGGGPHGTACAEIVYDVVPGAQLYLVKINTNIDLQEAVNYAIAQGVDVISTSLGWYNLTPGDGTGFFNNLAVSARNNGILWLTAASNDREAHWGGLYTDANANSIHEFGGFEVNCFGPSPGLCYNLNPNFQFRVFLRWNDWVNVNQDYDLFLYRWNGSAWVQIASGEDFQNGGAGQTPTEFSFATTSGTATAYGFAIKRFSATTAVNFELFAPKFIRPSVLLNARSLSNLADASNAMTVAALDVNSPYPQESYSSEGPSNGPGGSETGGAIKPDIAAYANVSTQSYGAGGFNGTSAATPHVAGAAALALSAFPGLTPATLQSFLQERSIDMGVAGKDTFFGYGRLHLGSPPGRVRFDVSHDRKSDLLWRNTSTGQNAVWLLDGVNYTGAIPLPSIDSSWAIAGEGDFNGDGGTDILWRNSTTGQNAIWFLNESGIIGGGNLITVGDLTWNVVGTDDFNADGKTDILWRNTSNGQNAIWLLDGTVISAAGGLPTVNDPAWSVVGTGDFNADGIADILWRNSSNGQNAFWFVNGTSFTGGAGLPPVADQNWNVVGTGDFNRNGAADILWRNSSNGQNAIWFVSGGAFASSGNPGTVADINWKIVRTNDSNGDGKADILWRNSSNGQNALWLMDGATLLQGGGLFTVADQNWKLIGNTGS